MITTLLKPAYTIFPAKDLANRISAHTDSIWKGNSKIEEFSYDGNLLVFKYILKEGKPAPLVFITINLASPESPLDLSTFNLVSLRIKEATNKRIMLFIKTYLRGVSQPEPINGHTLRHNQYILQLIPGRRQYKIKLKEFMTPPRWIQSLKVNADLIPPESYKKVITFDLQFNEEGSNHQINQTETIIIENISFHRSPSLFNYLIIGFIILYYAGLGGYLFKRRLRKKSRELPRRKMIKLPSYREKELLRIKDFIGSNYSRANISTGMVGEILGITSSRVFELVKEEYHLTFKQLINKLRIDEARRLLRETDLRITDIALNLGFNSVSYFNNLFKTYEGKTPSEYRDNADH